MDAPDRESPDTLNGWKEIATFLGKSVRSAQRWERELQLPVHRLLTPDGGQIISASRTEIDEWRKQLTVPAELDEPPSGEPDGDEPDPGEPVAVGVPRTWSIRSAVVGLGVGVALGALLYWAVTRPPHGVPVLFEFEGNQVVAFSDAGRRLWTYDFGRAASHPSSIRRSGISANLDDDGDPEVIVPVRFSNVIGPSSHTRETDAVVAFTSAGRLLWTVQPEITLTDGEQEFTGPWQVRYMVAGTGAGSGRFWVAYSHHTWRPGVVLEITRDGKHAVRYLQGGRINALAFWATTSGPFLAAGGTLADPTGTSLAIIDLKGPPARSPDDRRALTCDGCPTDPVHTFMLFPASEVTRAMFRPYGWVDNVYAVGSALRLATDEGFGMGMVGEVSSDFVVTEYEASDAYWQAHLGLTDRGQIDHSPDKCHERTTPWVIRSWRAQSGWTQYQVLPGKSLYNGPASR